MYCMQLNGCCIVFSYPQCRRTINQINNFLTLNKIRLSRKLLLKQVKKCISLNTYYKTVSKFYENLLNNSIVALC